MDAKTIFLHVDLEEEIYMEQSNDHCVFVMILISLFLLFYVDNMLIIRHNFSRIDRLRK